MKKIKEGTRVKTAEGKILGTVLKGVLQEKSAGTAEFEHDVLIFDDLIIETDKEINEIFDGVLSEQGLSSLIEAARQMYDDDPDEGDALIALNDFSNKVDDLKASWAAAYKTATEQINQYLNRGD